MPTATDELRDLMKTYFGDPIADRPPMEFLENAGYVLTKDWQWMPKSGVENYNDMTQQEYDCLLFLVQEWDFGGLVGFELSQEKQ